MGSEQNRCKNNQAVNNTPVITFVLPNFFFQISFNGKAMVFNKTEIFFLPRSFVPPVKINNNFCWLGSRVFSFVRFQKINHWDAFVARTVKRRCDVRKPENFIKYLLIIKSFILASYIRRKYINQFYLTTFVLTGYKVPVSLGFN